MQVAAIMGVTLLGALVSSASRAQVPDSGSTGAISLGNRGLPAMQFNRHHISCNLRAMLLIVRRRRSVQSSLSRPLGRQPSLGRAFDGLLHQPVSFAAVRSLVEVVTEK